jgi:Protein of unknown function (DUF3551)
MRATLIGLVSLLAAWGANAPSGHAQDSFFNKRYCTMGGSDMSSGMADCSYNTWEQCRASASGLSRYCSENPFWKPENSGGKKQKARRQAGRRQ